MPAAHPDSFLALAVTVLLLCFNLLALWMMSGIVRHRVKQTTNPEDATKFGTALVDRDPPEVARVIRAHSNAQVTIMPFLVLASLFVWSGAAPHAAAITFGIFVAARYLHSYCYLAAKQPGRSIAFGIGMLTTLALMGQIIWRLLQAA